MDVYRGAQTFSLISFFTISHKILLKEHNQSHHATLQMPSN